MASSVDVIPEGQGSQQEERAVVAADSQYEREQEVLEQAAACEQTGNSAKAEALLRGLLVGMDQWASRSGGGGEISEDLFKVKERALIQLAKLYTAQKSAAAVTALLNLSRPLLELISKARATKIVRTMMDLLADIPETGKLQMEVCMDLIAWSKQENRVVLRQSLQTRLISLYLENKQYQSALGLTTELLSELKRVDDKTMLVEVQLLESRINLKLRNISKSRAALTAAKTAANAMYCPPLMQAQLDLQSGILHAEEKDFKTAFSYFIETLEGFSSQEDPRALLALKYMMLCKIMLQQAEDVEAIVNSKNGSRFSGSDVDAMKAVAAASQNRSLKQFEQCLNDYPKELKGDDIISSHLAGLYDSLFEQNLIRLIEPFSIVEVTHIAKLIDLPLRQVESKLSQMILDKKFSGIIDQGVGCLIIYDETEEDSTYKNTLKTIESMDKVVDALFKKASSLS